MAYLKVFPDLLLSSEEQAEFQQQVQTHVDNGTFDESTARQYLESQWRFRWLHQQIESCGRDEGHREALEQQLREQGKPVVSHDNQESEVEYDGKVYVVDRVLGELIEAVVTSGPFGLSKRFGPHPERLVEKVPRKMREHLVSTPKGYIWQA